MRSVLPHMRQLVFVASVCLACWLGMMAVHESGHVIAAIVSGGRVVGIVLHPLTISRTDVSPNPHPLLVGWSGSAFGALLPLLSWILLRRLRTVRPYAQFFAGFCLVANGAYLLSGSFERIGDADHIIKLGTPFWIVPVTGAMGLAAGFLLWHRMGHPVDFLNNPQRISSRTTATAVLVAAVMFAACCFVGDSV